MLARHAAVANGPGLTRRISRQFAVSAAQNMLGSDRGRVSLPAHRRRASWLRIQGGLNLLQLLDGGCLA